VFDGDTNSNHQHNGMEGTKIGKYRPKFGQAQEYNNYKRRKDEI